MSRWGDEIYESDSSLDFFHAYITTPLVRNTVYWFAPEQVEQSPKWLREVLTLIEIYLIFDELNVGTLSALEDQKSAIGRWQEIFFNVWDAQWETQDQLSPEFHIHAYRAKNRQVMMNWFQRLSQQAESEYEKLEPFAPQNTLPYFSATIWDNINEVIPGSFFSEVTEMLTYRLVFSFSEEMREDLSLYDMEEVWAAVDVMGILCERYRHSTYLKEETIDRWFDKMSAIWSAALSEDVKTAREDAVLYANVVKSFDRLRSVTKKYPYGRAL